MEVIVSHTTIAVLGSVVSTLMAVLVLLYRELCRVQHDKERTLRERHDREREFYQAQRDKEREFWRTVRDRPTIAPTPMTPPRPLGIGKGVMRPGKAPYLVGTEEGA